MTIPLLNQTLTLKPVDRLNFQWMLEKLNEGRPGFGFFKCELDNELVYVFSRHQHYLNKRWPCLFIMGKGWQKPIILHDPKDWLECYQYLLELDLRLANEATANQTTLIR